MSDEEIQDFVAERVAAQEAADRRAIEEIPKSASGKILRRVLRDQS